ncbi:MAG: response regulator, partial [Opitutales bacterium]
MADPRLNTTRTRVLVVEDNPADRVLLKQRLGCITEPIFAAYAETLTAAEHMSDRSWDVVLLDLHLPGSRGLETLQRAQEIFSDTTPIIVLTGLNDEELGAQAMQSGAQDYLVKSDYNAALLQRTIRHSRERFKLNADLRAERARLNHILENTSEGIVAVGGDLSVQFANRAAQRILGQSLDALVRQPWPHPLTTEQVTRIAIDHEDGGRVIAELRSNRTRDQHGRLFLCTLRDISEEERLQQSLIDREKMAAVGELSSGIAHEFNNLLTPVISYCQLALQDGGDDDDLARKALEKALNGAERAAQISSSMLGFARDSDGASTAHVPAV